MGDGKLRIDLGRARKSDQDVTTIVTYSCTPRRGLYFNRPDKGYPNRPTQIWTQGQAEDSPYYFPTIDFPGEKSTSEVIATVPESQIVERLIDEAMRLAEATAATDSDSAGAPVVTVS